MQINHHLTSYEREQIEYYLRLHMSIRDIGKKLDRDHSVISREMKRNKGSEKRYRADTATRLEEKRRQRRKGRKLEKDRALHDFVVSEIRRDQSPDVIAGRIKKSPPPELLGRTISHESIYQYIYQGEGKFEGLYHHLLRGQHSRRKRGERKTRKRSKIQGNSIHMRDDIVATRTTFGHWESDSVIYRKQRTILSVQSERKSRLVRFHKAPSKSAEDTEHAIRKTVESLPQQLFQTMTFDNGTEGARHDVLKEEFDIDTYFCDPYSSWQKGGVENTNSIIRRYLPKTKDLSVLTDREIYEIQERINNTPRKCLGYSTPNELINQYIREVVH